MTFLASVSGKFSATAQVKSSGGASIGQQAFVAPGTYTWIAPPGVTKVSAVCIGGGGSGHRTWANSGGGGGGLGWKNNIPVSPGSSYTVRVGDGGRDRYGEGGGTSYFIGTGTVAGYGGGNPNSGSNASNGPNSNSYGGGYVGDGGGAGGNPSYYGGAGAGGYTGRGGNSGETMWGTGYGAASGGCYYSSTYGSGAGGGVGIWGKGSDGYYFTSNIGITTTSTYGGGGNGGSGGGRGHYGENPFVSPGFEVFHPAGGNFGGGGGGSGSSQTTFAGPGGVGAVRLIWGQGRAFPDTNTGDVAPELQIPFPTTGDAVYTHPGTYTWTCPPGVSSISVVCVGAGCAGYGPWTGSYGGGGGGLGYKNNYPVSPGSTYTVRVGAPQQNSYGQDSYFVGRGTVCGYGGGSGVFGNGETGGGPNANSYGGGYTGDGGGAGGTYTSYSGGGAGGYTGTGGNSNAYGSGGSGAGGYAYSSTYGGAGGGGVGLYGQGASGYPYGSGWYPYSTGNAVGYGRMGSYSGSGVSSGGTGGGGGSGGENGFAGENPSYSYPEGGGSSSYPGSRGGNCGGGGGPGGTSWSRYSCGGVGGVRIVWPGNTRTFPSTNVGDAIGDTMYGRGYWGGASGPDGRGSNSNYTHMFGPNGVREPQSPINNSSSTYIPGYQPTLGQA